MYKIKSITGKDGNERTDGRYPLRKGCIGDIWYLHTGESMVFSYLKDNEGNDKSGYLRTSIIEDYELFENGATIYTMNSVYYLESVEEDITNQFCGTCEWFNGEVGDRDQFCDELDNNVSEKFYCRRYSKR